ncbi:hypothetical protein QL285_042751 [Trifolium repens]|jgi:hypothetical protein|nr:hypothetical protein QL285_042751 [Trifolium repens]
METKQKRRGKWGFKTEAQAGRAEALKNRTRTENETEVRNQGRSSEEDAGNKGLSQEKNRSSNSQEKQRRRSSSHERRERVQNKG